MIPLCFMPPKVYRFSSAYPIPSNRGLINHFMLLNPTQPIPSHPITCTAAVNVDQLSLSSPALAIPDAIPFFRWVRFVSSLARMSQIHLDPTSTSKFTHQSDPNRRGTCTESSQQLIRRGRVLHVLIALPISSLNPPAPKKSRSLVVDWVPRD